MAAIDFIETLWPEAAAREDIEAQLSIAAISTGNFPLTVISENLGTVRDYAIALRAMHTIALIDNSKDSGYSGDQISSEREGELARTYELSPGLSKRHPELCQTVWGVKLIGLIQENFVLPVTSKTLDF